MARRRTAGPELVCPWLQGHFQCGHGVLARRSGRFWRLVGCCLASTVSFPNVDFVLLAGIGSERAWEGPRHSPVTSEDLVAWCLTKLESQRQCNVLSEQCFWTAVHHHLRVLHWLYSKSNISCGRADFLTILIRWYRGIPMWLEAAYFVLIQTVIRSFNRVILTLQVGTCPGCDLNYGMVQTS